MVRLDDSRKREAAPRLGQPRQGASEEDASGALSSSRPADRGPNVVHSNEPPHWIVVRGL